MLEEEKNPYSPPKTDTKDDYDKWLETIKNREETDWIGFCFVFFILIVVFLQPYLVKFLIGFFR